MTYERTHVTVESRQFVPLHSDSVMLVPIQIAKRREYGPFSHSSSLFFIFLLVWLSASLFPSVYLSVYLSVVTFDCLSVSFPLLVPLPL